MIIFAHILLIIGIYCTAWGISLPPVGGWKAANVFIRPLFWGLICIGAAGCVYFTPLLKDLF